jgi:hypothetical protein
MTLASDESRDADPIAIAAHRLELQFTDDSNLPARYRKRTGPVRAVRKASIESALEKRFKLNVDSWRRLIITLLSKVDEAQAWRFISLNPMISPPARSLNDNRDFCDFLDYMIRRRDIERCEPDEIGGLAMISVGMQREIEKQIDFQEQIR